MDSRHKTTSRTEQSKGHIAVRAQVENLSQGAGLSPVRFPKLGTPTHLLGNLTRLSPVSLPESWRSQKHPRKGNLQRSEYLKKKKKIFDGLVAFNFR